LYGLVGATDELPQQQSAHPEPGEESPRRAGTELGSGGGGDAIATTSAPPYESDMTLFTALASTTEENVVLTPPDAEQVVTV
jgi:hypothetical protein